MLVRHACVSHAVSRQGLVSVGDPPDWVLLTRMRALADQECPLDPSLLKDRQRLGDADRVAHVLVWAHSAVVVLQSSGILLAERCATLMCEVYATRSRDMSSVSAHHMDNNTHQ